MVLFNNEVHLSFLYKFLNTYAFMNDHFSHQGGLLSVTYVISF